MQRVKKVLLLTILSVVLAPMVWADVVVSPQWSEFCPSEYISSKSSRFNSTQNYWYNRRVQFEESLEQCNSYSGEHLKSCYSKIRAEEINNNKYKKI